MGNKYYKYKSTPHLPWCREATESDIFLDPSVFEGREVVVKEKMDGENCSMYPDHIHARSIDSMHHPSRNWVKNLHGQVKHKIPKGWRICGENLYAEHAIHYDNLPSYFMVFSIWNEDNYCLSWDRTEEWCDLLGLEHVPVLYRGEWDLERVREIEEQMDFDNHEGYVVRTAEGFPFEEFQSRLAKFVREGHVEEGSDHWRYEEITPNGLEEE